MKAVKLKGRRREAFAIKHGHLFFSDEEVDLESLARGPLWERAKRLLEHTKVEVDPRPFLVDGDMGIRRLMGYVFEEYVYGLLKGVLDEGNVERHKEAYYPIGRIAGRRVHAYPDFVISGKVAVEAKVGECDESQISEYSRVYPLGAVVFPYSGLCRTPKGWRPFPWVVKDPKPFLDWILYLLK